MNSYDDRLSRLEALVTGLNLGGCKYGEALESRLEELAEAPIKLHKSEMCDIPRFKDYKPGEMIKPEDLEAYQGWRRTRYDAPVSCQGDSLGQCEHGCDGVSTRGSCVDLDEVSIEEWEAAMTPWSAIADHCRAAKIASLHPADNVQSCTVENELKERIAELEATKAGHDNKIIDALKKKLGKSTRYIDTLHETINALRDKVMYDRPVSDDIAAGNSNKPRIGPVDMGGGKYGKGGDSGLGGRTEGVDSEQKVNIGDISMRQAIDALVSMGYDVECTPRAGGYMAHGHTLDDPHAPVQVVYCMGGNCYGDE